MLANLERRLRRVRAPAPRAGAHQRGGLRGDLRGVPPLHERRSPCEECGGTRLRKEARFVKVGGKTHHRADRADRSARRTTSSTGSTLTHAREGDRRAHPARDHAIGCRSWSTSALDYLSLDRTARHALGRRGAAHPAGHADRQLAGGRALHPRRAVDRPAPARQRAPARDAARGCATSATPCSSSSTTRRPSAPPTT